MLSRIILFCAVLVAAITKGGRWYQDSVNNPGDDLASGTINGNGNSAVFSAEDAIALEATLSITGATGTTPTLNLKLQGSLDGTNWNDVPGGAFPQQTGAQAGIGIVAGPLPPSLRWNYVVGGTTPSFTGVAITTKRRGRA